MGNSSAKPRPMAAPQGLTYLESETKACQDWIDAMENENSHIPLLSMNYSNNNDPNIQRFGIIHEIVQATYSPIPQFRNNINTQTTYSASIHPMIQNFRKVATNIAVLTEMEHEAALAVGHNIIRKKCIEKGGNAVIGVKCDYDCGLQITYHIYGTCVKFINNYNDKTNIIKIVNNMNNNSELVETKTDDPTVVYQ